jgi:cytochrome c-type biogenesis protein CcmH
MSWLVPISLALAAFAAIAFAFRVPPKLWPVALAALGLGLAGYATQASPGLPGAPSEVKLDRGDEGWRLVDLRVQLVGPDHRSRSGYMVTADALVREGQYANAATLLGGMVEKDPRDGDAWLALANALSFHADGALTPASLFAYRRAAQAMPDGAGPSFFVGLALIRQGDLIGGRELWAQRLANMPEDGPGRGVLAKRLGQLDELLRRVAENTGNKPH